MPHLLGQIAVIGEDHEAFVEIEPPDGECVDLYRFEHVAQTGSAFGIAHR